jgi:hypothetical protein
VVFGLGAMDPVIEVPTGGPAGMVGEDRSDTTLDMLLDNIFQATSYLDPTADDYFLRELYNKFVNPVDPENEGLPMDEFQDAPMVETLEASADTVYVT